jgi:biopolymer transport protein ExbD
MAEIQSQTGGNRKSTGVRRSKKASTKVDLTPMVDLGFLLITFFILTVNWTKAKEMNFIMPKDEGEPIKLAESTALTIIPLENDKIFYYHGEPDEAFVTKAYGITGYDVKTGIGEVIRKKQSGLSASKRFTSKDLMLVIKPANESSYKNLVDVMDEVLINAVTHYAVVELTEGEKEMIKKAY